MENNIKVIVESIHSMLENAVTLIKEDTDKALDLAYQAEAVLDELKTHEIYAKIAVPFFTELQRLHYISSEYEKSYDYGTMSLELIDAYKETDHLIIKTKIHKLIAVVADLLGDHSQAIKYAKSSLDYAIESGDLLQRAHAMITLAILHENTSDHGAQLELFLKAQQIYEKHGNDKDLAIIKNNLADTYRKIKKYDIAEQYISDSLQIEKRSGITYKYPSYLNTAGDIFYDNNQLELAEQYYRKAIKVYASYENLKAQVYSLMRLGCTLWLSGRTSEAIEYMDASLELANTHNLQKNIYIAHREFTKVFEKTQSFEKAYKHLKQYMEIKDVLIDNRVKRRLKIEQHAYKTKLARQEAEMEKLKSALLEQQVASQLEELMLTQDVTIQTLAALAETRDSETGYHIRRTMLHVQTLVSLMKKTERFKDQITPDMTELLHKSAQLHDVGKVGVPDSILLKPGKLSHEEFDRMKLHTKLGHDALSIADTSLGNNSFMRYAREIAYTHHERWDGTGYPEGLKEEDIPLSGRIMAIVDVYDALMSKRPYKEPLCHADAIAIIDRGLGKHFDPQIGRIFLDNHERFEEISNMFAD